MTAKKNCKVVLEDKPRRVTPSVYTLEMLQSTEERLANTTEVHLPRVLELFDIRSSKQHKLCLVDMGQPLFQPYPSELVFQNFTPAQTYKLCLLLLNNDKISRPVKLEQQHSEYFHVDGPHEPGGKISPGLSATFTVSFTPLDNKDYHHRLVFVTERERFEVPIRAIGPRAILDFRDEFHLPVCPVKASTEKTQLVRNIGNSKAKFTLHTQSPFSVTPSSGTLDVGESMQVTVDFNPMTVGDHSQDLLLHYHTGEDVSISLYGACEELNIHLEPDSALLRKTYLSLCTIQRVSLTNRSDIPLRYCWTTWPSLQEEALSLLRESSALQQKEEEDEEEKERLLSLCESDPTAIHRLPVLSKTLQERRSRAVQDHRLAISHGCITVEPAEGEIWPNITTQFVIVFKPEEAKLYQEAVYCDITGRQSRLPLTIKGEGVGPKIELSYNLMDMKNVFIGEKDCYEVLLCNRGLIDAPFKLSTPDTTFGRCFSLSPEEGVVPTGASQIVEVTFHTRILGTFSEDLLLTVTGQPEPLTLTFRGCVIGPTFDFNVSDLNFGDVGFGFPKTLSCSLFNSSYVPMTFALRVLGDGLGSPSVTWEQLSNGSKHNWQVSAARDLYARPAEFTIRPATGSVRSMSDITIKVTLCANTVRRYRLALVVDVEGVGEEIRTLPINARCVVPDVMVESTVLNFERCFLDYPYEQQVRLHNTSSLPACYSVLSEEDEESLSLQCGSSKPRGVIPPHSSEVLPVFLVAKAIGRLYQPLHIAVIGSVQPPLEVVLSCIGQGPIIHIQSSQLDFGRIQVLTDSTRVLLVSNESPIPAHFTARMKCRRKSFWRVEPSVGEVPPESQLELRVVAHLKDTLPFVDKLEVSVLHGQTHTVPLFATGTGTTIVSDRPFAPSLDLGTYFSPGTCQYHFKLTNHGLRTHLMYWQNDSFLSSTKTHKGRTLSGGTILPPISTPRKKDIPGYGSVSSSGEKPPVFSLSPSRVELFPGCSADMVLTGSLDCPKVVRERLKCRAIVGDQRSYEHIMAVDVTCRFEATMVNISPKQLNFYIKKVPGKSLMPLYEKLILTNVSPLSLSMELRLVEPFSLSEAPGANSSATTKSMVIGEGRQAELWVCFNPAFCLDGMSRVMDEFLEVHYQGHPKQDMVELHAEVHFPNLHFSSTTVDFGCVLNYTETRRQIWITNCSPLPVSYCWAFLETIRDTEKPEAEEEQRNRENETEEGWRSSRTASPASSVSLRQRPGPEEDSSTSHVFDILPHHGHLPPGEKQQVTLCFFGHENVSREAVAQCRVEEGPTYNIKLRGEASVISYSLDSTHVDFGLQLFDHVAEAEVILRNTGRLGFKFSIIDPQREEKAGEEEGEQRKVLEDAEQQPYVQQQDENGLEVTPGRPRVVPDAGYIDAGAEQCLCVLYLPGVPEAFKKRLQLQVAYLDPQDITLTGEGVFPRIILNLPQNLSEECYSDVVQQARTAVEADRVRWELTNGITTGGGAATEVGCTLTSEELLHMEIERMLVKENALAVTSGLLDLRDSQGSSRKWHKLTKFVLPEYVLDFGSIIPGKVLSHTVNVTNTGSVPVSFHANCKNLIGTGFSAEFERVKNLPCGETQTFTVKFDPQGANMGKISVVMTIQVTGGPVVQVRLCAVLTVPAVTVSTDTLEFDNVQCGMCQMRTIQLLNHESVPCYWSIAEEVKPFKKVDKFLPLYERKKVLQERRPPPVVFEMIPSSGLLSPRERVNVQIKFSPAEEHAYSRQLVVSVADSTQQVFLTAQGQGEEPQLDFCPPVLELGPCLPVSTEIEAKVVVRNPCSFPIEFYSLELDTQYLEEEKILRLMQGYDENNRLLLPPRVPGESLPQELLDYYTEHCSQLKNDAELKEDLDEKENGTDEEKRTNESEEEMHTTSVKPAEQLVSEMTKEGSSERLGQLEMTPVSRAIARHMCIDLSPEGLAARNRRGIAIIVYGASLIDKGSTAAALARHYSGACLSVDAVVTDVLMNGTSPVSLTARQIFDSAAAQYAERIAEQATEEITDLGPAADLKASDPAPKSNPAPHHNVEELPKPSKDSCSTNNSKEAPQQSESVEHLALCLGGDVTSLRNLLPEQLLVDILAERFQLKDCYRGIVIGSLESVYTQSVASTLQVVLKALNNRKHIYVVNLSDSYAALKARERAQRETEEALEKEKAEREEKWLQELDDEEYDALPEEEKERIVHWHREKLRQKKLRELERMEKEQEEKRQQEEMKRLREEELKKKSKKAGKSSLDSKELLRKRSLLEGKQSSEALNRQRTSPCNTSKESLVDVREQQNSNEVHHGKQSEQNPALHAGSPQPTEKLEREKSSETAEMKKLKKEKEVKKSINSGAEMDNKGEKEPAVALESHRTSPPNPPKEPQLDAKEQTEHLNGDASKSNIVHQSKAADPSQKKTDEAKKLQAEAPQSADKVEGEMSTVDELQSHFIVYEQSQEQVEHILRHWDRAQGLLLVPLPSEEGSEEVVTEKQTPPVGKRSKKANSKILSPMPSATAVPVEAGKSGDEVSLQYVIPHLVLNVTSKDYPSATEMLKGSILPPLDDVLDNLGLGPSGPPIPPPTTFSIVPFPKNREQSKSQLSCDCFTFLVPSGQDEDEEKKDSGENLQASVGKEGAAVTPSKTRSKSSRESAVTKEQEKKSRESQRTKKRTLLRVSSTSDCSKSTQDQHQETLELIRKQSLTKFRWVIPANDEVVLRIWFYTDSPGKFEQTFSFELLGTQRQYQLLCRGVCTYPSICKDYRTLFALSKRAPRMEEGIQKTYLIKPGCFEFGPLLCGKNRDRYKENKYPENTERLVIHNNSGLEAEVQFRFQHDTQATTYLLDPPAMTLKPDQKQELAVWAYPTKLGQIKDSVVCHIKDNPELVIIDLSCWGVRPELKLESKHLHFDRILLHRWSTRSVTLHNKTALPASWRLQGVEELGDEFSVPQDQGVISPNSSCSLTLHFTAKKQVHIKKILRLEVSDVEKILGIVQTENIHVNAEAYDIALEISPDDCMDFGTIKVFEEAKLSLRMKNQGKYEIAYKFSFQQTDPTQPKPDSIFIVSPQSGALMPHSKPTLVQILCKPNTEVLIREQPVLSCQVIEPSIGDEGETIAILPVTVSVKSVFSRYTITPAYDINFGPLIYGSKKNLSFTIENNGVFETCFTIYCTITDPASPGRAGGQGKKMSQESLFGAAGKQRSKSIQKDTRIPQNCLTMGVFSVSPCTGSLQPGSQQVVTVNCAGEQLGNWSQILLIDISDRDPSVQPEGIPYRLLAEVCRPGITLDMASIFEEHHQCNNSSQLSSEQFCNAEGIYVQEENKFVFNKVLVGQTARARFKLTNNSKVPCVLSLAIRYASVRAPRNIDVFDLSVTTLSIPSQSHSFAVITFTPQTMQLYSAVFEATIEGTSRSRTTPTFKSKELEFNLTGEGNLPSVCVVRPALRNSRGGPVLQFRRVLVGRRLTLPLVLLNHGNIPAQVNIDMLDKHGVFTLKAAPGNTCSSIHCTQLEGSTDSEHQLVHRAILRLDVNKQAEFEVGFCSDKPLSVKAKMSLRVEDNQYSCTTIPVTVEAYQEILSLSNISRTSQEIDQEDDEEGNHEVLNFGDCHVDCPYQESFTMTNHSSSQAVRFEWPPAGPHVCFSPQVGHLHAGCSKEVTVTFHSNQPVTVASQPMRCKVSQVEFQQPLEQVTDWDDRKRTVQWLSSSKQGSVTPQQHVKNKVIKTDPEPSCSVVEGSQWELELHISAVCDYVKFSCNTDSIHFKDTMLFQSRLHQLQIVNHSKVKLEFSFDVLMDNTANHGQGDETHNSRPSSRSVQTGARPASALASVMSLLMGNPELPPISVEPSIGAIEPSATQTFNIRFSPLEVAQFQGRLLCSIPNLQDGDQAPCISVCGRSLLPHCHFDLEESDYISGIRCSRGHLDPNTRVIEFNAVGFSTPLTRSFSVQNPTSKPYLFKWRCEDTGGSPFCCLTPSGTIQPGKKVEVRFKYVPEQLDVVESFWSFVVESLSLSVPFLCVGTTRQPLVYLDRPHVDFGELLVGRKVEQTVNLVNGEDEPFHFSVTQASLLCDDQQSSLILQPMTGMVASKERLPLSVSFTPCREGYVSFRLVLRVKRKSEPLALTVKADCFTMRASVQVEKPGGGLREISPNHQDTLDFGKVEISEKSTVNFLVSNLARFSLEVNFDLTGPSELLQHLEVRPQNATAEVEKQLQSSLFFCPQSICNLQDVRLSIKVKHGPKFIIAIKGMAVAPSLEFSFTKYNFGKCFLHCPGMVPASQTLVIGNKGERDMSVQCQFKNTSYLEIDFQTDILSPGAVMQVPVSFYPRETCRYHEKLSFILNSCVTKQVEILGQGIEMKLEVEDLRQKTVKTVKLGSLMLSQKVKKQVVLVNRSPLEISFTLLLNTNTLPEPRDLSISPASQLRLKAGASCNVEIQFSPRQHIPPFTAELLADFAGLSHPLLTIQGCCRGVEVELDQNHLSFGAVVQHCEAKKKIFMMNTGDIGSKFQWKTENFPTELSITPAKGYIGPGMQVPFELTFAPVELSNDARYENLSCCVKDSSSPVTLTVTGSCIVASTSKEVVSFACPVRGSQTQTLRVSNPMNQHCTIRPVIEGEQWSAATSVILKPLQQETYKITYRPLTMTAEGNKHLGSVFFPFPDGTGMLYSLQGTAEPPKAEDTIVHELPAKTHYTLLLPVHNWHSKQQRFRVLIEILKPDKPDAAVSLKGLQYIDVPALAKADYKMSFFTYKEGQYNSKVTFRNVSGEYLFYFVTFEATSPGVLSTIELVTPVRQKASATVQVENPLTTATYLTTECKSLDISAPSQHTVPGQSKGSLSFEYQPLRVGESTARLTLCSNDLGYFHYDLLLRALPAPPEKAVHFNTSLGSSHSVPVKFFNYSRVKTEYSCKTDCSHFTVDKSVGASPGFQAGSETSVEVCFDPHQLGEVRGQLTLSSTVGGEYIFPLHGMCLTPKAQGPFSIKAGRNVAIPFKNIFLQTTAFSFQVDNPCFTVKGVDTIPSKKTQNIMVSFELPAGGSPGPWFGNLTITSQRSEGHNKPCSWVFYLKGHRPET